MDITAQNYWWKEGGLWQDPDLSAVRESPLSYRPQIFTAADCQSNNVYTLRGPRRVGKTVALKLLISELIEKHRWSPRDILWFNAETVRTMDRLETTFQDFHSKFKPRLMLVDEITAVPGWQKVVKKLRDIGTLSKICLILTGSSAHDLKTGAERMAGRRGMAEYPDRVLMPMGFQDFCSQINSVQEQSVEDLRSLYMKCGGFPFRVEQAVIAIQKNLPFDPLVRMQVFDDVLFYEINRRRLDRNIALEVIGRLSTIQCQATSYEGFVKPLTIAKDTAKKYLDAWGDAFLLTTFFSYDSSRGRVAPKKDKKFMWVDPALYWMALWLREAEAPKDDVIAESVIGIHLLRQRENRLWEGLSSPRQVYTWKSSNGKEVDFLVVDKPKKLLLPVEVKYQEQVSDWDFQVMERAFGKGIMVTKNKRSEREKSRCFTLTEFLTWKNFNNQ